MTRVVMAASPVFGHVAPLQAIAARLVKAGHEVTFVTGAMFRDLIDDSGARFVPLRGLSDYDTARVDETWPARGEMPPGPPLLDFDMTEIFINAAQSQHEVLQEVLRGPAGAQEPAILLYDMWFLGAWPTLLGAPGVRPRAALAINISVLPITSMDTAPFGFGLPPDSSPAGRLRNEALNTKLKQDLLGGAQRRLAEVMAGLGVTRRVPFLFDGMASVPDQLLQLCAESFEYPRGDAPRNVRFMGAVPPRSRSGGRVPPWWSEVLAARRVVVVSQGTSANRDLGHLVEPALRALAQLDALVIAVTGRPVTLAEVPANARVAEFISFEQLFPHTDVLVSNGGLGAVQQALRYGVPLVLAGDTEDKIEVTAHAAWTGAAINLATGKPAESAIGQAVRRVLTEPGYRDRAGKMAEEYASYDVFADIEDIIDGITGVPVPHRR